MDFVAVPEPIGENRELDVVPSEDQVKDACAKLYGRGFSRSQIARAMVPYLTINSNPRTEEERLARARTKLRKWEMRQEFRDLIYKYAVVKSDLAVPDILGGLVNKAKRGRVDAAKLVLELTGRHSSRESHAEANVTVQIANIPRPATIDKP